LGFCFLRCFAEPVRKFVDEQINLSFRSAPGVPVTLFEKHDQMIALSLYAVDFI